MVPYFSLHKGHTTMATTARADLETLRVMLGVQSTKDDSILTMCLQAAGDWVIDRVLPSSVGRSEVQQATLLLASRLYKRRLSPEGVAGWEDMGAVRIIARDPDIERLLEQHIDTYKVLGIG
jgi:hypothetical protein